jgi:hypothetical protein
MTATNSSNGYYWRAERRSCETGKGEKKKSSNKAKGHKQRHHILLVLLLLLIADPPPFDDQSDVHVKKQVFGTYLCFATMDVREGALVETKDLLKKYSSAKNNCDKMKTRRK